MLYVQTERMNICSVRIPSLLVSSLPYSLVLFYSNSPGRRMTITINKYAATNSLHLNYESAGTLHKFSRALLKFLLLLKNEPQTIFSNTGNFCWSFFPEK